MDIEAEVRAESESLASVLGQCIMTWSSIEYSLAQLYSLNFSLGNEHRAHATLFAFDSFHSKLQIVKSVFAVNFAGQELYKEWNTLESRLKRRAVTRNIIAHATGVQDWQAKSGKRVFIEVGIRKAVHSATVTGKPRRRVYIAELQAFLNELDELARRDMFLLEMKLRELQGRVFTF